MKKNKKIKYLYIVLAMSLILSAAMAAVGFSNSTAEAAAAMATATPAASLLLTAKLAADPTAAPSEAQTPEPTQPFKAVNNLEVVPADGGDEETPAASETPAADSDTDRTSATYGYAALDESQPGDTYTVDNTVFGISSDGSHARATTDGINAALAWAKEQGYTTIKFQTGTYMIQCNWKDRYIAPTDGILVPSGLTLDLGDSTFKIEPNSDPEYCIFGIVDASDVTIKNGTLIGDRDEHVYAPSKCSPTHEYGFGICISASKNVRIQDVTIRKMTGDGIIAISSFYNQADGGRASSRVRITGCDISECRRQGISVVGVKDSEIAGNRIYNISGTSPEYGIDVESALDYVNENIKIHDNVIYGCAGGAVSCNNGTNYEVFDNVCSGNILAVFSSNVSIYANTIKNSFIQVMTGATNITVENNILDGDSRVQIDA
jgi:hypothetical protein